MVKIGFYERLGLLGFQSYEKYLQSPHWKQIKWLYRGSNLPQYCLGCNSKRFHLHHRSYIRLGQERIGDLIPLCEDCHKKVHEYQKDHRIELKDTHIILRKLFKWSRKRTKSIFRPFSNKRGWNKEMWGNVIKPSSVFYPKVVDKRPFSTKNNFIDEHMKKAIEIQKKEKVFLRSKMKRLLVYY